MRNEVSGEIRVMLIFAMLNETPFRCAFSPSTNEEVGFLTRRGRFKWFNINIQEMDDKNFKKKKKKNHVTPTQNLKHNRSFFFR